MEMSRCKAFIWIAAGGYFGFKSSAAVGKYMAQFMAEESCPQILKPFALKRYEQHKLMGETAALVNYSPDN